MARHLTGYNIMMDTMVDKTRKIIKSFEHVDFVHVVWKHNHNADTWANAVKQA